MSDFIRHMKGAGGAGITLDEQELAQINRHTLRAYTADELFAFKLIACDNEVDRDGEAFPEATLQQLANKLLGKTVIADHQWKAENQCARIYAAQTGVKEGKTTSYGVPYVFLEAHCYMPRTEETKAQIDRIEAGIQKEVSIGCAVRKHTCSICGKGFYSPDCIHKRGDKYDGNPCFVLLEDAADAFEVSFAAVPIQPAAGVTKSGEAVPEFRAELESLTRMVKELTQEIRRPAVPQEITDSEAQALIQSAKALLKITEGDMYK